MEDLSELQIRLGQPYLKAIQDFADEHRHRATEVLGPHAGAEIAALGKGRTRRTLKDFISKPREIEQIKSRYIYSIYIFIKVIYIDIV